MAYYVPLGSRGVLLRIGTRLITVVNGLIYWQSYRLRRRTPTPSSLAVVVPNLDHDGPQK